MADDNAQGNQPSGEPEKVQLTKAELDALRGDAEQYGKLATRLKEIDFDGTVEEYLDGLEQSYLEEVSKNKTQTQTQQQTQQGQQSQQQNQQQQSQQTQQQDDSKLQATNRVVAETKLSADLANFRHEQSRLKDDEKSLFTEKELADVIKDPKARNIILSMLPEHNQNLFAAADVYLTSTKGKAKMIERGQKIAEAKIQAAGGSAVDLGGRAADAKPLTVEEWQKQERTKIAPPDKKYVMPG